VIAHFPATAGATGNINTTKKSFPFIGSPVIASEARQSLRAKRSNHLSLRVKRGNRPIAPSLRAKRGKRA